MESSKTVGLSQAYNGRRLTGGGFWQDHSNARAVAVRVEALVRNRLIILN
jgi:hypothetical protein